MFGRRPLLLLVLFFASGASSLVYELVWVRQFGTLYGSSVYSAAVVTAIYMCGLGLGAWLVADFADRRFRAEPTLPLVWYARFELAIAALAALVMLCLPQLARIAADAASYRVGAHGWFWLAAPGSAVRYGCAALLLLPITLLMGGTLTLLIRYVVADDVARAGWLAGLLYGVNTAGAAIGCLATDTWLVPNLGIRTTQELAIAGSLFAAAGAAWLARASARGAAAPEPPAADPAPSARAAPLALALAGTGFASMAMQIVWFRQMIAMFGAFRPVFSLLLFVILTGIWLGALIGGRALARFPARALFGLALAGFAVSAAAGIAALGHDLATFAVMPEPESGARPWLSLYAHLLREMGSVVVLPACFAGAAFPLANAIVQGQRERVGERVGLLYLANTFGGVCGSLAAGFVLLPRLGIQATVTAVIAASLVSWLASCWATARGPSGRRAWWPQAAAGAAILAALFVWTRLPPDFLLRRSLPLAEGASGRGVVAVHEGVNETIAIIREPGPALRLLTNGYSMSGTPWQAQRYMRAFVHVPMLLDPAIERVLVMCFGVGTTVRATLFHPQVRHVDLVDLSADVLEHSAHFEAVNGRPLEDPRVSVYVNDARHHLLMQRDEGYDLITGEPPPITHAGAVNLYTQEFFALLRSRLRPGGYVTYWLPLWQVGGEGARAVVRAFLEVFPGAVLLSGHGPELILVGRNGGSIEIDPEQVMRRLAELPALRGDMRGLELATVPDLVGMLAATTPTLERATRDTAPLRDDRPLLEYAIREVSKDWRIPAELFSVADVERWCPRCFHGALDRDGEARLRGYLEVMALYYRSEAFLAGRPVSPRQDAAALSPEAERAIAQHLYLQDLLFELPPAHKRAINLLRHGRPRGAVASLEQLLRVDPGNDRARADLAFARSALAGAE